MRLHPGVAAEARRKPVRPNRFPFQCGGSGGRRYPSATNDGNYGLVALTRDATSGEWQKSAVPTVYGASYMQASYAESGEWLVACNLKQQENDVALFVSQDDGATFSSLIELALPANDTGNARIELPAQIGDWLPVFVQMENNQRLQQLSLTGIAQKGVDGLWG